MKASILKEEKSFREILSAALLTSTFLFNVSFADTINNLSTMPVQLSDTSLPGGKFSARREDSLCVYRYEDEPFGVSEEACIDSDEYMLGESRWSNSGEHLAVLRFTPRNNEGTLAVYTYRPDANEYELAWSVDPSSSFPQVNSLSIVGWINQTSILIAEGCGNSCSAVSIITSNRYRTEAVTLGSDFPYVWDSRNLKLNGVDRAGKLFQLDVDVSEPAEPALKYSDYYAGCLDDSHWFRGDENKFWYKFEERLDDDTTVLSTHLCDLGTSFSFASPVNVITGRNFSIENEEMLGSPISLSNDRQRIASIRRINNAYYLDVRNVSNFETVLEIELASFSPDLNSIGASYDFYSPIWSPDDTYILVPKSPVSGAAIIINVNNQSEPVVELNDSSGRLGFFWITDNKFIAKNISDMNIYEIEAGSP